MNYAVVRNEHVEDFPSIDRHLARTVNCAVKFLKSMRVIIVGRGCHGKSVTPERVNQTATVLNSVAKFGAHIVFVKGPRSGR